MRTIAVVNQKGGCGKTITSINLSAFLARARQRVLLVDMDPQGHATLGLLGKEVPPSTTMYEVFLQGAGGNPGVLREIVCSVRDNLHVAPADILLSAIPETLAGRAGREDILSAALASVQNDYDYVVVDCPPTVGVLTFNALKACSEAIVPMDPSFFSLHGIGKLLETFEVLARETGHRITPRVLVTLYSGRSPFVKAVVEEIHHHLEGRYFQTLIRYSIKLAEAASHGVPVADYCTSCAGFEDYQALAAEVLAQEPDDATREPIPADATHEMLTTHGTSTGAGGTAGAGGTDYRVRPSAPAATPDGVLFTFEALDAERVHLAGDFNDWALDGNEMEPTDGLWTKVVKLPPGRYRYRYVVDGQWRSDPLNAVIEPSTYGGHDSILVVVD
jgi:chromosome partitioning protein